MIIFGVIFIFLIFKATFSKESQQKSKSNVSWEIGGKDVVSDSVVVGEIRNKGTISVNENQEKTESSSIANIKTETSDSDPIKELERLDKLEPEKSSYSSAAREVNKANNNKYQYTDLYEDPNTGKKPKPQPKTEYTEQNQVVKESGSVPKKKIRKKYWDVKLARPNQKAFTGGTLSFILMEDAESEGEVIPKGTVMSGLVNIQNNRIYVRFTSVAINYEVYPLNFTLCNTQGIEGLGIIQNEDNSSSTRSGVNSVVSSGLSSVPIVGGILGGVVNDATNKTKKESYKMPNSYRAKITTFENNEIY